MSAKTGSQGSAGTGLSRRPAPALREARRAAALLAVLLLPELAAADRGHPEVEETLAARVAVGLTGETGIEGGEAYRLPDDLLELLASPEALPPQNTGKSMKLLGPRAMARRLARHARAENSSRGMVRSWIIPRME